MFIKGIWLSSFLGMFSHRFHPDTGSYMCFACHSKTANLRQKVIRKISDCHHLGKAYVKRIEIIYRADVALYKYT